MAYQHKDNTGCVLPIAVGKAVCIGRNYMDHIQELNNAVPTTPLLFMKPKQAMCDMTQTLVIPTGQGECHNELEVAVLLQSPLRQATSVDVKQAIWGIGIGLDLTLRDVQQALKEKGQPWERAKAFDNSCPLSGFVPLDQIDDLQDLHFSLDINGQRRQTGHTALMLNSVVQTIVEMSNAFALDAGDVVLTGTPKGVGPLTPNDTVEASLNGHITIKTEVVEL